MTAVDVVSWTLRIGDMTAAYRRAESSKRREMRLLPPTEGGYRGKEESETDHSKNFQL